jgi:hypothetical protein
MIFSHDECNSWSDPRVISGLDMATRDSMLGIQEIVPGSGNLMAVFESVGEIGDGLTFEERFAIWSVISRDDGITWGERRLIYKSYVWDAQAGGYISEFVKTDCIDVPFLPSHHGQQCFTDLTAIERNSGAPQIALLGRTWVVSFVTDKDKMDGMWHRNAYVKIITSADQGMTWGNKLLIAEKPAAWSGLLALNETNFLVLCDYQDRSEAQRVALV